MSLISLIIANLPAEIQGVEAVVSFIAKLRTAAQQAKIWSPDDEAAFVKLLADSYNLPQWKTDKEQSS